jgi:hypothetical protein
MQQEKKYNDMAPKDQAPTFDDLVRIIEKNFKGGLFQSRAFTEYEVNEEWIKFKTLNHLYQDETKHPSTAIWVKASEFKFEVGVSYNAKDEKSRGAGFFHKNGAFLWGDGSITHPRDQDDLLILDENESPSKEGNKERETGQSNEDEKQHFDNWHRWLSENGYTYDGEFYYDEDNNYYTPDQLWGKFK